MADFKIRKIIEKKRNGEKLSQEEIRYFVNAVSKTVQTDGEIYDGDRMDRCQIGAMLMAIYLRGLDQEETTELTINMKYSGFIFSWPKEWKHLVVDKHSTGGVGDKVSLILAPALATLGLKVPMISGRSLGHTGGTLDKLESIPGFRVSLSKEEIYRVIESTGCCIVAQTSDIVPADKIIYQCREITATVTCPSLIIASIVSKKLAEGTEALIYDVKFGKGSIFNSKEEAQESARHLIQNSKGTRASALLTSMETPLGRSIGNSVEVLEAIDCLKGKGPADLTELTSALGGELLRLVRNTSKEEGVNMIMEAIKDGRALKKFQDMVISQGVASEIAKELCYGNPHLVLPKAQHETDIIYDGVTGYIQEIDPLVLATTCKEELFLSNQHPGIGLILLKSVGDTITRGEAWLRVHHQSSEITDETQHQLKAAIVVGSSEKKRVLIDKRIFFNDKSALTEDNYH